MPGIQIESSLITSAIQILFYLAIAVFAIGSALALYSLIRYGKDRLIIISVSATYLFIAITLFFVALNQLGDIKF